MGSCNSAEERHVEQAQAPLSHLVDDKSRELEIPAPKEEVVEPEPEVEVEPEVPTAIEFPEEELMDGRTQIELEQMEERDSIRLLRLKELPKDHRIKRFLNRSVARWKFNMLRHGLYRQERAKQHRLASRKVGSIHIGVDVEASKEAHGVVLKKLVANPKGGKGVTELAGLQLNDVLVCVRYDDAKAGGEKRTAEPLDEPADLRLAVGPAKEVYEGTVLIFSYLRGADQVKAWRATLQDRQVEGIVAAIQAEENSNTRAALTLKLCKRRLALLEKQGTPAHQAEVEVGPDTSGAEAGRKKQWAKIKECEVLCVQDLSVDSVEAYLSDPVLCKESARKRFDAADADASGSLDADEIYSLFRALAKADGLPEPSRAEAHALFQRVDLDKNGSISFDEFYPFFRRRVVQIICGLEKDMTDHVDGVWVPKAFGEAKARDVRMHVEEEYRAQGAPAEFIAVSLNKEWKCSSKVNDGVVSVIATSRDGLHKDDTEAEDFIVEATFSA